MNNTKRSNTVKTNILITGVFILLAASLQVLMWLYWQAEIQPRLYKEAKAHADLLAQSQSVKLSHILQDTNADARRLLLSDQMNEILLFSDTENNTHFYEGLHLYIDYDVVDAPEGSLDIYGGNNDCGSCFTSEIPLFSPVTDELMGLAIFQMSDSYFETLKSDIRNTLTTQSAITGLLLLGVWGTIIIMVREINRSRQKAEDASKSKSAFLANISHELRTPLNAIIGFSEMHNRDSALPEKYHESISIINKSGEYLLGLINDVLELSRLDMSEDRYDYTPFNLYSMLESTVHMMRIQAEKKGLRIIMEMSENTPEYICTDQRKLHQILLNFLNNSVKFTEEGGVTIRVHAEYLDHSKNIRLLFEIEDSGSGISEKDQKKIFEPFSQGESGYSKKEGVGLGLAICQRFIKHLGGEITVKSIKNKGSLFSFTIKARTADARDVSVKYLKPNIMQLTPEYINRLRVLVVDDNSENRRLLSMILENVGFIVKCAENGEEAVAQTRDFSPELIWMDIRMPVKDGYQAVGEIRKTEMANQPVIIALTASAFSSDYEKVMSSGFDDFVRRPFRVSDILDKMQQHMGVQYIYEEPALTGTVPSGEASLNEDEIIRKLSGLDSALRNQFITALELCDMLKMEQLSEEIERLNPYLEKSLRKYLNRFQYDKLAKLFEKASI